jgi:hypothetical protein
MERDVSTALDMTGPPAFSESAEMRNVPGIGRTLF